MKIHCLYDKLLPIGELKPHPKNRNKHPNEQIERLAKVLGFQGWRYPIKVSNRSGFITSGHGRLAAAKLRGWASVPVNFQDYDSEEQEIADVPSDNAIASWAELDFAAINVDVTDLGPDFDIDLLGIKDFTLDVAEKSEPGCDEDEAPQTPQESKVRLGDLWHLGGHRLLVGDSTVKENVERLMNGEKADMVFTDPPYGIGYDESRYENTDGYLWKSGNAAVTNKRPVIEGDSVDFDPTSIFSFFEKTKEIFIWGANNFCQKLPQGGSWVCWQKKDEGNGGLYGDFELAWSKQRHRYRILRKLWGGFLNKERSEGTRFHPTQKPIELITRVFDHWGKDAKIIWDGYLGSGSTLIACEKTNRRCFGMEIDPHYCSVILSRWAKYSGKDPVREDGAKWSETNAAAGQT